MNRLQEIKQAIRKVAEDPDRVLAYRGAMWSALEAIDEMTEGYVLVPEDKLKAIQELWSAGLDPDEELSEIFKFLPACKGDKS